MPASLISTPGAITSLRPASWRWAITIARRGGRGINNTGSRPFGVRVSPPGWAVTSSCRFCADEQVLSVDADPLLFELRRTGTAAVLLVNLERHPAQCQQPRRS